MPRFQPTLPARGATTAKLQLCTASTISTHAPRTGSDDNYLGYIGYDCDFNPRSPHGERHERIGGLRDGLMDFNPRSPHGERLMANIKSMRQKIFQPTLPARGATAVHRVDKPCVLISTHAPRTGSDRSRRARGNTRSCDFNPRSPHGERRTSAGFGSGSESISTHAPRTGSDFHRSELWSWTTHFNPRSPHGERRR